MSMEFGVEQIQFTSYETSIPLILDRIRAGEVLKQQKTILIKPNLVNASPFPVTTALDMCRAVIAYIRNHSKARLIVAEGCGDAVLETPDIFEQLGYGRLASELGVELLDLNHAPLIRLEETSNEIFPEIFLPEIAFESYILSLPVLKAHSLAVLTGTLKNMMGFAPPKHYSGGGFWKKSFFHARMQTSIKELNRYLTPDLTVMDASVGLCEYHLGGAECSPPLNHLIAGYDPVAIDRAGARLLGLDPENIHHLS